VSYFVTQKHRSSCVQTGKERAQVEFCLRSQFEFGKGGQCEISMAKKMLNKQRISSLEEAFIFPGGGRRQTERGGFSRFEGGEGLRVRGGGLTIRREREWGSRPSSKQKWMSQKFLAKGDRTSSL